MGLGIVVYQISVGLTAYLAVSLIRRDEWQKHPWFVGYLCFCLARSLVLFPLWIANWEHAYHAIWFTLKPVGVFLMAASAIEVVMIVYPVLRPQGAAFAALPTGLMVAQASYSFDRLAALLISGIVLTVLPRIRKIDRKTEAILTGILISNLIPAFAEMCSIGHGLATYIPSFAFLAALLLWIRGFRMVHE